MADTIIPLDLIKAAQQRIAGHVVRTPLVASPSLSTLAGVPVLLKLEHRQETGSFKLRGATNALLAMPPEVRARGVAAASTGNHGRAVAFAASRLGVRCVICLSRLVPDTKVAAIRTLGAEVRIVGASQDDAQQEVDRLMAQGLTTVPPFDDAEVIAGQGTIGLEIVADAPDVALILVPLSGGGLAGGIAAAVKAMRPETRAIGVSMQRGAAMHASVLADRPVLVEELPTLADSLGGGIGLQNRYTLSLAKRLLDAIILLSEAEIAAGIAHAYAEEREIVEGGGAVGIGALLAGKIRSPLQGPIVIVLSGRNIDMSQHRRVITEHGVGTAIES